MKASWKALLAHLAIPLLVGGLSALLTRNSMEHYEVWQHPPLSPPGTVFPIVWTILFLLMGYSAYRIWRSKLPGRERALVLYALQLLVNFLWPLLFFRWGWLLPAFFWILLLIGLVAWMIALFYPLDHTAALLQFPYLLWLIFAAYLNLGVWWLNRI
ncbi:TspO/MBR family protein [Pseudoflavonifractor gallinarum]|uniref:TspO/MBR family protein n=1 Tax=Pseudoflavonifractor gallinarum TaxID=2779352 RepID=UPI0036F24966